MSQFIEIQKKGLSHCWIAASLDPEKMSLHITEIPHGTRAHPPHAHNGTEAFSVYSLFLLDPHPLTPSPIRVKG